MNPHAIFLSSALLYAATAAEPSAALNRQTIDEAFADWTSGRAAFYDLLADGATVTIAGQSPHSGSFSKTAFLRERARPFQARFLTRIIPVHWTIDAVDDQVIVRWDSAATPCDGRPYRNSYAYFITMQGRRISALTMFLDMAAFDDVWQRCPDLQAGREVAP